MCILIIKFIFQKFKFKNLVKLLFNYLPANIPQRSSKYLKIIRLTQKKKFRACSNKFSNLKGRQSAKDNRFKSKIKNFNKNYKPKKNLTHEITLKITIKKILISYYIKKINSFYNYKWKLKNL